jgi:hypothetical protein
MVLKMNKSCFSSRESSFFLRDKQADGESLRPFDKLRVKQAEDLINPHAEPVEASN